MSARRLTNISAGAGDLKTLAATVQREFDSLYKGMQSITVSGVSPISVAENVVSIQQASASQDGYLSALDYARFSDAVGAVLTAGGVTPQERANWNLAYSHAIAPSTLRLDQVLDPAADKTFAFGTNHLLYRFTNPSTSGSFDGAFEIDGIGNFTGDLVHIHQSAGNSTNAQDILHVEVNAAASSANPLRVGTSAGNALLIDKNRLSTLYNVVVTTDMLAGGETRGLSLRAYVDASNYFIINNDTNNFYLYGFGKSVYIGSATTGKYTVFVSAGVGVGSWTDTNLSIGTHSTHGDSKTISSTTFASGYFGGGWKLDYSAGQGYTLEIDNLVVRNTLRAFIFQKDIVRASNGYLFISDVSEIVYATTIPDEDTGYIYTKEAVFQAGDFLWYKDIDETTGLVVTGIKAIVNNDGAVGSYVTLPTGGKSGYRYEVSTYVGSTGTYRVGGTVVRVGSTAAGRQGSIYFDSSSPTYAPFMDVYDGVATWPDFQSTTKVKLRIGKLTGITTGEFGTLSGYGIYTQNAYLTGNAQVYGTLSAGYNGTPGPSFYAGKIFLNILVAHSERFSTWNDSGASGITWTDNNTASPEGPTTATRWVRSGGTYPYKYTVTTVASGTKTFTFSFWAKAAVAGTQMTTQIVGWGAGYPVYCTVNHTLTTGWLRYSATGTAPGGSYSSYPVYVILFHATDSSTLYTWGAQLEEGGTPSVYQRTDGSGSYGGTQPFGMWAISGGFGGSIHNPVVKVAEHGITIMPGQAVNQGTISSNTIMIGNVVRTSATSAIMIANTGTNSTSGLFGYDTTGEVFRLRLDGDCKISGWTITSSELSNANAKLNSSGYISFGATPPTSYGNNVGVWLGYSSGAKLSLYSDASNYMQWDGSALAITGATFTSGIIRTSGANTTRIELNGPSNVLKFVRASAGADVDATSFSPQYFTFYPNVNMIQLYTTTGSNSAMLAIGDFSAALPASAKRSALGQYSFTIEQINSGGTDTDAKTTLLVSNSVGGYGMAIKQKFYLTSGSTDAYAAAIILTPQYSGGYTVTRHNYMLIDDVGLYDTAACTNACVFWFNAAPGAHKAVDSSTTKSNPGSVSGWIKVNMNGTLYYVPAYTSKTS
jgi:hypothetical protein